MCWSQPGGVDLMQKKRKAGEIKKNLHGLRFRHSATTGQRLAVTRQSRVDTWPCANCFILIFFLKKIIGKFKKWAKVFGRMGVQHTHFLKLVPTLGSDKSSIPHGVWRFHFFPSFIFVKFRVHLDLDIHHWDSCSMKN
jgi:hypothetical protein